MIVTSNRNIYTDGTRKVILHKSEFVEAIAGLRSYHIGNIGKQHDLRNFSEEFEKLEENVKYSIRKYGEVYAGWLLIMDIATYISRKYYENTGETYIGFEKAMEEYDKIDLKDFLYIFLGMPALGYELEDAERWLKNVESMSSKDIKTIGQYISQGNVKIFIRNIKELKEDLKELLYIYWKNIFKDVWKNIESSVDKTIDSARNECTMLGDVPQYLANVHKDIKVAKGNIYIQKEVPYSIKLEEIKNIHLFPSAFSGEELLIDISKDSLIIYYNLNLNDTKQVGEDGKRLCKIFKILGDDTRLKIAKILWGSPTTTQYIASMLGMAPSTVSSHLKVMHDAGLVTNKAVKKYVYYEVNQEMLAELGSDLVNYLKK